MSKVLKSTKVKFGIPVEIENQKKMVINNSSLAEKIEVEDTDECEVNRKLIEKQHKEMIQKAKSEAQSIIQNAKNEAEILKKEIFETAREEGYNKGYHEVTEKAEGYLKEAEEIKTKAEKEFNALMMSSESEIISLVTSIIEKVCGSLLNGSDELIVSLTQNMLSKYKSSNWVKVRVSSEDYDQVIINRESIIYNSGYSGEIEFKKDISLEKGSCVIEADSGIIDASIQKQLDKIKKYLKELCNS